METEGKYIPPEALEPTQTTELPADHQPGQGETNSSAKPEAEQNAAQPPQIENQRPLISGYIREHIPGYFPDRPEVANQALSGMEAVLQGLDRGDFTPGSPAYEQARASLLPAAALDNDARLMMLEGILYAKPPTSDSKPEDDQARETVVRQLFSEIKQAAPAYREKATLDWGRSQEGQAWIRDALSDIADARWRNPVEIGRDKVRAYQVRGERDRMVANSINQIMSRFDQPETRRAMITVLKEYQTGFDRDLETVLEAFESANPTGQQAA